MRSVAVVGAGAVGVTAALDLAERGVDATVYEADEVGSGASERAAGIVHDAFAEDVDAALAARAGERFRAFADDGLDFTSTPYVLVATGESAESGDEDADDGPEAAVIRESVPRMRDHGRDVELVSADWLRERYPQVRIDDVVVAAVAHDAGIVDAASYAPFVAERAQAAGAEIREGTPVAVQGHPPRVLLPDGEVVRYDAVVVAAGADTGELLVDAGHDLPLEVYESRALLADGPAVPTLYDATDGYYLRSERRGLIAGLESHGGGGELDDEAFVARTRAHLDDRLVNYEGQVQRSWSGRCTGTPDGYPLLGPVSEEGGLYVATGWHGRGLMLAPATGEAIAAQVLGGDGVSVFDPVRSR